MDLSAPLDVNTVRKAMIEAGVLYTAADCGLSFDALSQRLGDSVASNEFWFHTRGALRGSFVINWCKLFGIMAQDAYWKRVTLEQKPFREAVYAATGFDYQGWDAYRKTMSDLKAVLSEHLDPYYPLADLPDFGPAMKVLEVAHHWLREVAAEFDVATEGPMAQENYFDKVRRDIADILDRV
ncbi:MAG: hypothetical protein R3208_16785 [Ketobacteraceae bacterium]|nr:hypothetical protein [Ketobacteraceae bacterium]